MSSDTSSAAELRSGKGDKDENFPVASWIIHPRHRALILAFYNFVRTADDIADHASLSAADKLTHLDTMEADLVGEGAGSAEALNLRRALATRNMSPRHALDVLKAFRLDVTKLRYDNWDDLIDYCRYSAMPVGRFMLDVHGEDRATYAASDKLCAALQINNHLQDCGKDFRDLDRVYIPQDALAASGATVADLGKPHATPQLLSCIHALAARNELVLAESRAFADEVRDVRLGVDIAIIDAFAQKIVVMLKRRDPLSEKVHLSKAQMAGTAASSMLAALFRRATGNAVVAKTAAKS